MIIDYLTNGDYSKYKKELNKYHKLYFDARDNFKKSIEKAINTIDDRGIVKVGDTFKADYYENSVDIFGTIKIVNITKKFIVINGDILKNGLTVKKGIRISKKNFYNKVIPDYVEKVINRDMIIDEIL